MTTNASKTKADLITENTDAMLLLKRVRPFLNAPDAYTQAERDTLNADVEKQLKVMAPETES